jgi:thiamine-monophosphate kinase
MAGSDEFEIIARLMRPLAAGAPEALNLADDAALIPGRPGYELVVTKDAIVEGVHFLASDPLDQVAQKLLRVNLSDLAAKGASPYGYLLVQAWPKAAGASEREAFAAGLAADQAAYRLSLFGGDTVVTPGPALFSATMFGWVREGAMVRRDGAKAGDLVQVSGVIGDGVLGLKAALGELASERLAARYRLPVPRLDLSLEGASAAADISDGLIADAGHLAAASGVRIEIDLARLPLSDEGRAFAAAYPEQTLVALATGGDDYELVVTAAEPLAGFTVIGAVVAGSGVGVFLDGAPVSTGRAGWVHGRD